MPSICDWQKCPGGFIFKRKIYKKLKIEKYFKLIFFYIAPLVQFSFIFLCECQDQKMGKLQENDSKWNARREINENKSWVVLKIVLKKIQWVWWRFVSDVNKKKGFPLKVRINFIVTFPVNSPTFTKITMNNSFSPWWLRRREIFVSFMRLEREAL